MKDILEQLSKYDKTTLTELFEPDSTIVKEIESIIARLYQFTRDDILEFDKAYKILVDKKKDPISARILEITLMIEEIEKMLADDVDDEIDTKTFRKLTREQTKLFGERADLKVAALTKTKEKKKYRVDGKDYPYSMGIPPKTPGSKKG